VVNVEVDLDPSVVWTTDCCGKWGLDGHVVGVDTRGWPARIVPGRPPTRPSAVSSFNLHVGPVDGGTDPHAEPAEYVRLWEQTFEADTVDEVKALVDAWVR
jgi:hypothetical protein